ncbi:hypothetical protein [Streptomyces vietnamensis]|uniref:Uncharacterized protein n=1 Tax=Streptomyces vietnamensis TaxID=362257 RepID=A0A0B5IKU3_9ACTN|nr:hypothetical protein [Streptomyces vietnamensis]AJF69009.1 hypothetical protein SVTN_36660 [Streptomyces vietnamensis]
MSGRRYLDWLGLTPEPERELPAAVAALRASFGTTHHPPPGRAELAAAERRRVEWLVLRGSRHSWLRYLAEATALVTAVALRLDEQGGKDSHADTDAGLGADADTDASTAAALLVAEVILDHHRMLIGLPGAGYGRTEGDRDALESALRLLRTRSRTAGPAPTARTGDGR